MVRENEDNILKDNLNPPVNNYYVAWSLLQTIDYNKQ